MTETEKKALALLNEVAKEMGLEKVSSLELDMPGERALLRAIEQHEAFRQEVSEFALGIQDYLSALNAKGWIAECSSFIIAKPDPLDEAVKEAASKWMNAQEPLTDGVRAAIEKRGGKIVWGEG